MKTKALVFAMCITGLLAASTGYGQAEKEKSGLKGYLAIDMLYHSLDNEPTGMLGLRGGLEWNRRWGLGLMGQALWYDVALNEVVPTGTYHLQAGMAGFYVSYAIPMGAKWQVTASIATGSGVALYQYDKEWREDLAWYEEIIDRDTFGFLMPGVEIRRNIGKRWWIGAEVMYRTTSEIDLEGMPADFLNGLNPGLSLTYNLF